MSKKRIQYNSDFLPEEQAEWGLSGEDQDKLLALTADADPVLSELWDNEKDASYDQL